MPDRSRSRKYVESAVTLIVILVTIIGLYLHITEIRTTLRELRRYADAQGRSSSRNEGILSEGQPMEAAQNDQENG